MTPQILTATALLAMSFDTASFSVWKVEKDVQHLYVAGTAHLLSESDYPLPDAFDVCWRCQSYLCSGHSRLQNQQFRLSLP